jgi:hypothetical protein
VDSGWTKNRNPIAYTKLGDFGLNLADLEFQPMPARTKKSRAVAPETETTQEEDESVVEDMPLTIPQAKRGLALSFGVSIDNIEIVIRA